jgi:iron complex outermembrane receptor protein
MKHRYLNVKYVWLFLFAFVSIHCAQAQVITGTITDAVTNEGLPGVNVLIKGTTTGTVTDFDGNYSLEAGEAEVLVISSVGYLAQEITVGNKSVIDIRLEEDVQSLDEIVVTGYGTQEKKEISSSIASVKEEDFNRGMVNDPAQLIQGKVAGLNIGKAGGDPNDGYKIRLRGVSTFGANQEPLVVVDGVIGVPLSAVDPSDIASIDVLKDGSAAAIYGTRGSSGVIIVTTKTGNEGTFRIDYNGSLSIDDVDRTMDFMSASQYLQVPGSIDLGSDVSWLDAVTEKGVSQVHNLSASGGTASTTYRASVNLRDVDGIEIGTGFQRVNTRLNLTQKAINDNATITLNVGHTTIESNFGAGKSFNQFGDEDVVFRYAVVSNPTLPVFFDGSPGLTDIGGYAERDIFDYYNPRSMADQVIDEGTDINTTGQLRFEYDFSDVLNGLRWTLAYSRQWDTEMRGVYIPSTVKWGNGLSNSGNAGTSTIQKNNELFETMVNWDGTFGNTDIAALGGYSYQDFFEEGHGMWGGQFLTDAFTYHNMSAAQDFANGLGEVGSYAHSQTLIAFFGRVNANIDNTFFLSASVRYEGSSRFGENNKWGTFPAISGAVNLSNLFSMAGVDQLKFRASYGRTGATPADSYISLARLGPVGNFFYNGSYVPSYGPQSNPNPDLAWETKDEVDFGLDFAILEGRLSGTMDYYVRNITDMIVEVAVPVPPNLYPTTLVNIGELKSSGFEFALNFAAINQANFSYNTGLNFATFNTDIESLTSGNLSFGEGGQFFTGNMGSPGQNDTRLVRVKEGEPLGDLWGPVWDGQTVDANGVPIFEDLNGDGTVCDCDDDRQVIGNGLPDFTIGWNNSLTLGRGWDATIFFRGSFGHDLLNSNRGFYENTEGTTVANYNIVNTKYYNPAVQKAVVNSIHVEDASFFKLDNMSIGYNFDMSGSNAISNMRLYVAGQNLFTITDYTGIDPEVRYVDDRDTGDANDPLAPGIERRNTYFTTRTFTLGLTVGF